MSDQQPPRAEAAPVVSVVIATRDRSQRLTRLLDALAAQDFEREWELIVVDDASRDETPSVLAARERVGDLPLRLFRRETPGGPGGARNTGWRDARAELVAFTDDDCEPAPEWLSGLVAAWTGPRVVVQGRTEPNPGELDRLGPFARTLRVTELGPWFPTCNMAYPREALERLGGFEEAMQRGEDTDLAWRAREAGYEPVLAPGALVRHAVMELGAIGQLQLTLRWIPAVVNFRRHPGLRGALAYGVFWKRSHAYLLLALAGVAIARRFPPAIALALPYVRDVRARVAADGASLSLAPYYAVYDAVETGVAAIGSARAGTFVL